ncbi:uncharacterized protein FOMMEDRAFT_139002 [Fomitiporia mediterranea MF3/22]|uniref:uncharacterized protein n=1 Tax=Fomitiporia mediterranea (strain MF3/22) TaxID=694068 RepID=UPI0004408FB7|nr:uncharacterized protein FOMMEDRAFT_139002 [Fomitiporia mediterranea MF3/22]EJD05597.1 hypothetical protein FOMMEDRAFT_139002 [Fomitiporia mediterranea MF3/22]
MILLDEIDVKEKVKRESLPPYSPRRSLRIPIIATPPSTDSDRSFPNTPQVQSFLHPRSASWSSTTFGRSQSSLTLNSNASSQTLLAPFPSPPTSGSIPGPSTSQISIPYAATFPVLPAYRASAPSRIKASNNVYIERECAAITGTFLIDPTLQVPDCLLPDDPGALLFCNGKNKKISNGKKKQKRKNLCLVTRTGDISVDIWIREGSSRRGTGMSRNGGVDSVHSHSGSSSHSSRNSLDSQETSDYWKDWTSPPSSHPWPEKLKSRVEIDIRSESGSITVRIHAQSHQRLRINATSVRGPISIGIPRTFVGQVESNKNLERSGSSDSMSSLSLLSPISSTFLPGTPTSWSNEIDIFSLPGSSSSGSLLGGGTSATPITPRQPVQFSLDMEQFVTPLAEHKKSARGRYLVGDSKYFKERPERSFDELHLESRTGTIGVFYDDEAPQQKSDRLIVKLLNKAW